MGNLEHQLQSLCRSRLLSRAAKNGVTSYQRKRDLKRIIPGYETSASSAIILKLLDNEQRFEEDRRSGSPGYSLIKHVEILIAIAAEGQRFLTKTRSATDKKMRLSKREPHSEHYPISLNYMKESGIDSFFCAT